MAVLLTTPLPGKRAQCEMASPHRMRSLMEEVPKNAVDAAVLVLLTPVNDGGSREAQLEWEVLLIRRNSYAGVHSGQIAFPGGKREKDDADLFATACREAFEELGIAKAGLNPLGPLSELYVPPSNYVIHPFLALRAAGSALALQPDEREVVGYRNIPMKVFNPAEATPRPFDDRKGGTVLAPSWRYADYIVWGATAMILAELYRLIEGNGLVRV